MERYLIGHPLFFSQKRTITPNGRSGPLATVSDAEPREATSAFPLPEGWVSYPTIDILEVPGSTAANGSSPAKRNSVAGTAVEPAAIGTCETDFKNQGETLAI